MLMAMLLLRQVINPGSVTETEHCFDLVSGCFTLNLYDAYSDGWGGSGGLNHTLTVGGSEYTFEGGAGTLVPALLRMLIIYLLTQ